MNLDKINLMKLGFILLCIAIAGFAIFIYKNIFTYILLSFIFIYFANPFVTTFENLGIRRIFAILIFYLLLITVIFFIIYFLVPIVIRQSSVILSAFNDFINLPIEELNELEFVKSYNALLSGIDDLFPFIKIGNFPQQLQHIMSETAAKIPNYLLLYTKYLANFVSFLFVVPVIRFFMLKDLHIFKREIFKLIPNRYFEISIILINRINTSVITYLKTLFIEVCIVGLLTAIVLSLLGVKFALIIGMIAGLFNIVPYLGPFSAAIFASLSVLLTGKPVSLAIWTIVGMWGVQVINNNVVFPLVMSKGIEIHPMYIFITAVASGLTFGFLGILLALPTLYLITTVLQVLYKNLKDFSII